LLPYFWRVYSGLQLAWKFARYYRTAQNGKGHGMHSPFVFDFILNVLNNGHQYHHPEEIESLRKKLLQDKRQFQIKDLGAGSRTDTSSSKTVSQIARSALKPRKYAQLLFRLVKHYQPVSILELGTSLGITTAYLSKANPNASITTIEGSDAVLSVARENLLQLNCHNVKTVEGNFDEVLPDILEQQSHWDLAYVDGNHRYTPTINYFRQILPKMHAGSILVFDDIHWSREMEQAWKEICNHPDVKYTIDVFFLGFVFFRDEFKVKQNFSIRF